MWTLELRLEELRYGWTAECASESWVHPARAIAYLSETDHETSARLTAALEFFDRALVQGMGSAVCPAPHSSGDHLPDAIFRHAAALTLLRFGVRIVGLEAPEDLKR